MASALRLSDEAREAAWRAMCVLTAEYKAFTVATVANLTSGAAYPPIAEWMGWLQREMVIRGVGPQRLAVEVTSATAPPRNRMTNGRGAQQQRQIWTAMRKLRNWTDNDLVEAGATEECELTLHAVRTYSRALARGGIIQVTPSLCRLKPSRDTGPRAPISFPDGAVYDLNVGDFVNLNRSGRVA